MRQLSALPIKIISMDPANLNTADAACFGVGDNGLDYMIKTVAKAPAAPAAELICHAIAEESGIPVPQYDVVMLRDGSLGFGSVWDAGALKDQASSQRVLFGSAPGKSIDAALARIFVLDMFVHNVDRHAGNYLCVSGRTPGYSLKAFDFSRAFTFHGWPLPTLPMDARAHTITVIRALHRSRKFDLVSAEGVLTRIEALQFAWFKQVLEQVPVSWLPAAVRKRILTWWANGRTARVQTIRQGAKNASLF
jgi:hypothetical protein